MRYGFAFALLAAALASFQAPSAATGLRKSIAGHGSAGDAAMPHPKAAADGEAAAPGPVIDAYRDMLERPLFSATRRPAPVRPRQGAAAAAPLPVLRGIVISPRRRIAVVEQTDAPTHRRVIEGQETEFGTIHRVLRDRVVIRKADGTEVELRLKGVPAGPSIKHKGTAQ